MYDLLEHLLLMFSQSLYENLQRDFWIILFLTFHLTTSITHHCTLHLLLGGDCSASTGSLSGTVTLWTSTTAAVHSVLQWYCSLSDPMWHLYCTAKHFSCIHSPFKCFLFAYVEYDLNFYNLPGVSERESTENVNILNLCQSNTLNDTFFRTEPAGFALDVEVNCWVSCSLAVHTKCSFLIASHQACPLLWLAI